MPEQLHDSTRDLQTGRSAGTNLATSQDDRAARFRFTRSVPSGRPNARYWLPFLAAMLMPASCIVPPSVDPVPLEVVPSVFIDKSKADPRVVERYVIPPNEVAHPFDITGAVHTVAIDPQSLRYYWYYDYARNTGRPLDSYAVCAASQARCNLYPCQLENASPGSYHFLMVVVSDLPLRVTEDTNRDMFDFPANAHFDSVQWDVKLTSCPTE